MKQETTMSKPPESTEALTRMPCHPQVTAMTDAEVAQWLALLDGWTVQDGKLVKEYRFADFHATMAFTDALAALIHAADHHPDLALGYNRCRVSYNTHSVNGGRGGLSENDFICAAQADALYQRTRAGAA